MQRVQNKTKRILLLNQDIHHVLSLFLSTEAIETILSFSKNAEELLKRKKVYRDLIFKYLAKEGVTMPPNSEKHQLVKRALELWASVKVGTGSHVILTYFQT